jgi:hypothetical protein
VLTGWFGSAGPRAVKLRNHSWEVVAAPQQVFVGGSPEARDAGAADDGVASASEAGKSRRKGKSAAEVRPAPGYRGAWAGVIAERGWP